MKHYIIIALVTLLSINAASQQLKVGDKLPDILLTNLLNHSKPKASIKEFNRLPLLIQFWSAGCGTCMGSFRKLDTLQHRFKGRLQFLLVTPDATETTKKLFNEHSIISKVKLPCVVADTILRDNYFYYLGVPHEVWISAKGEVLAITGYEAFTIENLEVLANGGKLNLKLKKDAEDIREFYTLDPLFTYNYKENRKQELYYSYITGYREGIRRGPAFRIEDSIKRMVVINSPFTEMYKAAFKDFQRHASLIQVHPSVRIDPYELFSYDIKLITADTQKIFRYMLEDLNRFFGLTARIEKKMMPCYVLKADSATGILPSKYKKNENFEEGNEKVCRYIGMHGIYNQVNQQHLPVVDETGFKRRTDVRLPADVKDIALLKKYLQQSGIILTEENRMMEVIVIE